MEKITRAKFDEIMREFNKEFPDEANTAVVTGVIVFDQSNWDEPFTEQERSYRVSNANRMYQQGKIANSLFGDCLDGKDIGVRLDWYNWKTEYCYLELNLTLKQRPRAGGKTRPNNNTKRRLYAGENTMEHMSERVKTAYMLFDMKQALFEEAFKASENGDEATYKVLASIIDRAHTTTQYEEWSKRQKEINERFGK